MADDRIAELKREAEEIKAKIKAEKDSKRDTTLVKFCSGMLELFEAFVVHNTISLRRCHLHLRFMRVFSKQCACFSVCMFSACALVTLSVLCVWFAKCALVYENYM